jgi:hypothetical protein
MTNYDLEVTQGSYGYDINFTVTSGGSAKNLMGYTVTWKIWNDDGLLLSGALSLVVAASGTCKYTVQEGDFDVLAEYNWLLQLTKAGEKVDSDTYSMIVKPTAPTS